MKIVVTQRIDLHKSRNEYRDSLDQKLIKLLVQLNHTPVPVPNSLVTSKEDEKLIDWINNVKPTGLLISGGNDIGQYLNRDKTEETLYLWFLKNNFPILGICRGMQILSVAHGGRMHQHLDTTPGHEGHGGFFGKSTEHGVVLEGDSQLASIMGDSFIVNSLHHQGVSDSGSLDVSARADHDGLIEGVERKDKKFCLGVQWHPERKGHDLLFSALIEAARG